MNLLQKKDMADKIDAILVQYEQAAFDGVPLLMVVGGTAISIATEPGRLCITWPNTPEYDYMLPAVLERGYEPGRNDGKPLPPRGAITARSFVKVVGSAS